MELTNVFAKPDRSALVLDPLYSTVPGSEIARAVSLLYDVGPLESCHLLVRGFNDTYKLRTAGGLLFFARLQAARARGLPNSAWEMEFLNHLKAEGVRVAAPLETVNGTFWSAVETAGGLRILALFEPVAGEFPGDDLSDIALMGGELARIHAAGESFSGAASRYRLDVDHLLTRPLATLLAAPTMDAALAERFSTRASALRDRFEGVAGKLTEVLCHGDCHGGNTFVSDEQSQRVATFFDFDDGGPGYLSYELAVFLWSMLLRRNAARLNKGQVGKLRSFVEGYREVRAIPDADLNALPLFVAMRHFWLLGEYAGRLPEWGMNALSHPYLSRQAELLDLWEGLRIPRSLRR